MLLIKYQAYRSNISAYIWMIPKLELISDNQLDCDGKGPAPSPLQKHKSAVIGEEP